jgi:L-asparaginase
MENTVQVFVTGGTFDKEYNYLNGELYFKDSHIESMFDRGRCTLEIDIKTLMMIDSLEMTDHDRELIYSSCQECNCDKIIITHGTDTMVETATYLSKLNIQKTIIFTGAMIPYAFGNSSDGFFNLGSALAFAQCLPIGIYIAMNGRYFPFDNVKKNRETGTFEKLY